MLAAMKAKQEAAHPALAAAALHTHAPSTPVVAVSSAGGLGSPSVPHEHPSLLGGGHSNPITSPLGPWTAAAAQQRTPAAATPARSVAPTAATPAPVAVSTPVAASASAVNHSTVAASPFTPTTPAQAAAATTVTATPASGTPVPVSHDPFDDDMLGLGTTPAASTPSGAVASGAPVADDFGLGLDFGSPAPAAHPSTPATAGRPAASVPGSAASARGAPSADVNPFDAGDDDVVVD